MGVPEFWRFNGKLWRIYQLQKNAYVEVDRSPTFPMVAKEKLYEFLSICQQNEVDAEINFRTWVRDQM